MTDLASNPNVMLRDAGRRDRSGRSWSGSMHDGKIVSAGELFSIGPHRQVASSRRHRHFPLDRLPPRMTGWGGLHPCLYRLRPLLVSFLGIMKFYVHGRLLTE
jgi:hypothetical protein